jgi:hypothetical protein
MFIEPSSRASDPITTKAMDITGYARHPKIIVAIPIATALRLFKTEVR